MNHDPNTPRHAGQAGRSASGPPAYQTPTAPGPSASTGTGHTALTTSNGATDPDADWAGKGFAAPGPPEPTAAEGWAAWENEAWVAGYAAGVESGLDEFIALLADRDKLAATNELLRIERDEYAARAHTAEQELHAAREPGHQPQRREADAG